MVHHQLMGPMTASRLPNPTLQAALLSQRVQNLRTIPVAGDLRCRFTRIVINIWQYTSAEMIRIKQ